MSFVGSLILFAAVVAAVLVPMFFGHALSVGVATWYIASGVALVVAAALMALFTRVAARRD